MLNYINSELFRISRNRKMYLLTAAAAGLIIAMTAVLAYFGRMPDFSYATTAFALGNEYNAMNYLLLVVLVLSVYLDDNEWKQRTMKHSVAYGISRRTIYLGRFFTQMIVCAVIYAAMNLLLVGVSFALLRHSSTGEVEELLRAMAAGLPLFLFALAVSHCFIMNMESTVSAQTAALTVILLLPLLMNLLGRRVPPIAWLAGWHPYNLASPFFDSQSILRLTWNMPGGMARCYLAGTGAALLFTVGGAAVFERREIK